MLAKQGLKEAERLAHVFFEGDECDKFLDKYFKHTRNVSEEFKRKDGLTNAPAHAPVIIDLDEDSDSDELSPTPDSDSDDSVAEDQ